MKTTKIRWPTMSVHGILYIRTHDNFSKNRSSIQRTGKSKLRDLGCFTCPLNALAHTHARGAAILLASTDKKLTHTLITIPQVQ